MEARARRQVTTPQHVSAQFEGTLLRVLEPELVPLWCDPEL
jgi:hypothetical protein